MKIKVIKSIKQKYDNYKVGVYADVKESLRPVLSVEMYNCLNSEKWLSLGSRLIEEIKYINKLLSESIKSAEKSFAANQKKYDYAGMCGKLQICFCLLMGLQQYAKSHLNEKYLNEVNVVVEKVKKSMITKYNKFYNKYVG